MKQTLAILLVLITIIPCASASIPVTPVDIGTTYIRWNWTPAGDVTDIFIDGIQTCGYDTTAGSYLLAGLNPGELHTIQVINATDTGLNTTSTLGTPGTTEQSASDARHVPISSYLPVVAIVAAVVFAYSRKQ